MKSNTDFMAKLAFGTALLLLIFLTFKIVIFLDNYGSPFPFLDDWHFQNDKSFITNVFTLNNENFQVFTNALYWLAPRINIPFGYLRYVSLFILITMLFVLYLRLKNYVPQNRRFLLLLAFTPAFSAYMATNLLWTGLSQAWIYFLLIFLAVKYGFEQPLTPKNQLLTFALLLASCIAMNVSLPLIFTILYVIRIILSKHETPPTVFRSGLIGAILMILLIGVFYIYIRHQDATSFSFATLFTPQYWLWLSYATVGVLSGLLISADNTAFYYLGGIFLALWLLFLFTRQIHRKQNQSVWVLAIILLGGIAMITLFRGEMVLSLAGHASRHILYGICLIPVIYTLGISDNHKIVRYLSDIFLVVMLICSLPNYRITNFWGNYHHFPESDLCLMKYINPTTRTEKFTCGRAWHDLRKPFSYFLKTDAAFKPYNDNNSAGATIGFVPYHFEGKVFYKIPTKKILLFR